EPRALAARGVRRGAEGLRLAADADPTVEGHAAAGAWGAAHGDHPAGVRDAAEHRAVRRPGPPGDERAVRAQRRAPGRDDADREALRRDSDLSGGVGVREGRGLEGDPAVGRVKAHWQAPLFTVVS